VTSHQDPKYLALVSDVIEGLKEHYHALLSDEDIVRRVTERSARFYRDTGDTQADYARLRDGAEKVIDAIEIEEADHGTLDFATLAKEIEEHETGSLVAVNRNEVNGYITFRFYDNAGELAGKLTFDEICDDMIGRAKAVADHLASSEFAILYQSEVENAWDAYDADSVPPMKA
jgi:hypothetical protein